MIGEDERKGLFRANPMAESFLAVLLQDAQHNEDNESCTEEREGRDVGTIYTAPESTLRAALLLTDHFKTVISDRPTLSALLDSRTTAESMGSDLYLELAGHGAGFRDRSIYRESREANRIIGEALSAAADITRRAHYRAGNLESYIGDDGAVYILGMEA